MSSTLAKIDNVIDTFLSTLKRFPFASISAFLLTIILINLIDSKSLLYGSSNQIIASKVAFVATLAVFLFPALRLLTHRSIFPILGLVLIAGYYYLLPSDMDTAKQPIIIRHILLAIALFFMIIWAPFVGRKTQNDNFWQWTQDIIFGLITATFFGLVVYAGIAGAMYALKALFHLDFRSVRYAQVAMFSFGIVSVIYFLSQIPRHPLFLEARPYSKVKRTFAKIILGTITFGYFIILYAYSAKILLTQTWPTGTLSWIIVAFSLVAILTFLFWTPFLNKKSTLAQRFLWLAIFLQTLMLGLALYMRVMEYGITFNRYLLGMLGIWLLLMSLYFMLFGKAQQKWLFFFASVMLVASQFGPYSANAVTQKSQTNHLVKLIQETKLLTEELNITKRYNISNKVEYIHRHYGLDAFEKIIPNIVSNYHNKKDKQFTNQTKDFNHYFPHFATKELGFKFIDRWEWENHKRDITAPINAVRHFYTHQSEEMLDIREYDYLLNYNTLYEEKKVLLLQELNVTVAVINNQFEVKKEGKTLAKFDLNKHVQILLKQDTQRRDVDKEFMTYEEKQENIQIKILFQRLIVSNDGKIINMNSKILLKI